MYNLELSWEAQNIEEGRMQITGREFDMPAVCCVCNDKQVLFISFEINRLQPTTNK
jgi:hypothetical protein